MKLPEWVFKILAALAVPLTVWGIKLEVNNAVQDEKISSLEDDMKEAKNLQKGLAAQDKAMGIVQEKIDATNRRLDEIKGDLRRSLPPGP